MLAAWLSEGSKQPIALAELLPVVMAKILWEGALRNRSVIYFVDNDSVMFQLIKGSAHNCFSRCMLLRLAKQDLLNCGRSWFTRVPSSGNVADDPSRLRFTSMHEQFKCTEAKADMAALCWAASTAGVARK
jgi:hypothetical protein